MYNDNTYCNLAYDFPIFDLKLTVTQNLQSSSIITSHHGDPRKFPRHRGHNAFRRRGIEEYDDNEGPPPNSYTVVKYLLCQTGASFSFKFVKDVKFEGICDKIQADCYIDDEYVESAFFGFKSAAGGPEIQLVTTKHDTEPDGIAVKRTFIFQSLISVSPELLLLYVPLSQTSSSDSSTS